MPTKPLLGIDITTVSRVNALRLKRPEFAWRAFTGAERAHCADQAQRWATRWAAKEAVRKLAGAAEVPLPGWLDIEVEISAGGAPWAHVRGWAEPVALSLSHEGDTAVAVAMATDAPLTVDEIQGVILPDRSAAAHKGSFGLVVVAAGSKSYSGAAYLAAMGAARGGAGLVQLMVPESIYQVVAAKCAEVMVTSIPDEDGGFSGMLWRWIDEATHASSVVIGCGLGQTLGAQRAVIEVLSRFALPMVVDADGLNTAAAKNVDWRRRPGPTVLTPHPAEMARLCSSTVAEVQADRLGVAKDFAARHEVVVVLKGAHTVVAAPDGRSYTDSHDVVALATAGTGDVLAGVVGAMLAQGMDAYAAGVAAVTIHAEAGRAVQREQGRSGGLASDVIAALPSAQERTRRAIEARR